MPESFDAFQLLAHFRRRWGMFAAVCGGAVALALVASLLAQKQYTATCQVMIEPPVGTDLRSAMVLSPIYLESLRTYEHFASSDSMFREALEHFKLRDLHRNSSLEALKQKVLKVQLVRNTKILEIRVTLPDAAMAHALAAYLAGKTVDLNRSVIDRGNRAVEQTGEERLADARRNRDRAEADWIGLIAREPIDGLHTEIESQQELKQRVQRDLLGAEADLAEYQAGPREGSYAQSLLDAKARAAALRRQVAELDRSIARQQALLAERVSRREKLQTERKAADAVFTALDNRLRELRGDLGYRGERLEIIDPGVVPERPSSPNLPLNLMAALLAGLALSLLIVTLEFGYRQRAPEIPRPRLRVARGARDE